MPEKTYPCPRCGKATQGSYSLGGVLWAICDTCMTTAHNLIHEAALNDEQRWRQAPGGGWHQGDLEDTPIKEDAE